MSIDHDPSTPQPSNKTTQEDIPDTMPYTEEDRELARNVQAGAAARGRKLGHLGLYGAVAGGVVAVVLIGGNQLGLFGGDKTPTDGADPAPNPNTTSSASVDPTNNTTETEPTTEPELIPQNDFTVAELERLSAFCIAHGANMPPSTMEYLGYTQAPQELIDQIRRLANDMYEGKNLQSNGQVYTYDQACSTISKDMLPYTINS